MQTVLTVLPLQSDSPKTDVCEGLAVTAAVIKSLGFFLTEVHICGTHLVAIYLPLDKRLSKLFVFKKKRKTCGPEVLTFQSAVVSCVVQQLC